MSPRRSSGELETAWTVDAAGWLNAARRQVSPHCDERPAGVPIELAVIHNISLPPGEFGGGHVQELFDARLDPQAHPYFAEIAHLRVSAHFLIERGGQLTQFVPCAARAWHAGVSCFEGRQRCNDFSIGIELEGSDDCEFEAAQYLVLEQVLRSLAAHYPLRAIAGHSDIAPGRKTDPGACFDWRRLREALSDQPQLGFPYL